MIDLNDKQFEGSVKIINNGKAGLVRDVDISITKKAIDEPDNRPDYKLIVKDPIGEVTRGFYYFKPNPEKSTDYNALRESQEISRVVHLVRAVMGQTYKLPEVNTAKEAFDALFEIIMNNVEGKKFNIFLTFGSKKKPSNYLEIRYFDFIESANDISRLRVKNTDNMERIIPDQPGSMTTAEEPISSEQPNPVKENWDDM